LGERGITIDYFWPAGVDPFTPGVPQGFTIGYSPGAQAAVWCATAIYTITSTYP